MKNKLWILVCLMIVILPVQASDRPSYFDVIDGIPKVDQQVLTVPTFKVHLVTSSEAWDDIIRQIFREDGKNYGGIALVQYSNNSKIERIAMVIPAFPKDNVTFVDREMVFGHELMHILDFTIGTNFFDPDTWHYFSMPTFKKNLCGKKNGGT